MRNKLKSSLSVLLSAVMITSTLPATALATEVILPEISNTTKNAGGNQSSDVKLIAEAATFNVTLPTVLPVDVDANNNVTVATNVEVINNSAGPVRVSSINIQDKNNWTRVEKVRDRVGLQEYTFNIKTENDSIASNQATKVIYDSTVSPQKQAISNLVMAEVIFTIGWNETPTGGITEDTPSTYEFIPGDTKNVSFTFNNVEDDSVTWSSSNDSIATVEPILSNGRSVLINGTARAKITAVGIGTSTITATTGDGFTKELVITVLEKGIVSIEIVQQPDKTEYRVGEVFSATGMVVEATYNNGTTEVISDYTYNTEPLTLGQNNIEIVYGGKSVIQNIEVLPLQGGGVVDNYPASVAFTPNDIRELTFNYENIKDIDTNVTWSSSNESIATVTPVSVRSTLVSGSSRAKVLGKSIGTCTIKAKTADGFSKSYSINVEERIVTGIEITKQPDKTEYYEGEVFDPTGMEVTATYNNGNKEVVNNYTYSKEQITVETGIVISLGEKNAIQNITLKAPLVNGETYTEGNYKYTYNSSGWSVKIIDNTQTVYKQPLEEIKGKPVTSYLSLFKGYPNTALTLEGTWTNSNVTNMDNMFYDCKATTLDLSNFNTTNITSMAQMFYGNQATTLDLSSFNTSNVKNMIYVFKGSQATTLDLSSFNTSKVTNMYGMFDSSQATTLDLGSFNTSNVTLMPSMFQSCKATTGYARTQADADKFNTSSNKPTTLNFIVKQ